MLYQEISRFAREEQRIGADSKEPVTSANDDDTRNDQLLQLQDQAGPVAAEDVERLQQPLYGSQDQLDVVDEASFQSKDENWVEYKTNERDAVNDRYYLLLQSGKSTGSVKKSRKRSKEKMLNADSAVYDFEGPNDGDRNAEGNQFSNSARFQRRRGQNNTNATGEILKYRGREAGASNQHGQSNARRVVPPAPHSLYRQPHASARFLVYVCDAESLCGGWGDRQRGIMSTYFLSRLVGRQMKIIMPTPCDLINFYIPNRVPWVLTHSELDAFSNVSINAFAARSRSMIGKKLVDQDLNELYPQQVIYLKTNQDYYWRLQKNPFYRDVIRSWTGLADKKSRFQWAWKDLMRPSPRLLAQLERVLGSEFLVRRKRLGPNKGYRVQSMNNLANNTLICAHVRFGKNPSFPNDTERRLFSLADLPALFNFMLSRDSFKNARFYLASDYQLIKDKAEEFFSGKLLNIGLTVMHIDRQRAGDNACDGFESALIDQQILSLCDVLVVSRSGFSIHASFMAPAKQQVFMMAEGNIQPFDFPIV